MSNKIIRDNMILYAVLLAVLGLVILASLWIGDLARYRDLAVSLGSKLLENASREEELGILLDYAHNIPGDCVPKSNDFELLAKTRGYEVRHIALLCDQGGCSHSTSQVLINGSWIFFDAYLGRVMTREAYLEMGYGRALRHLNCYDGACSNLNFIERIFYFLFYVKPIW